MAERGIESVEGSTFYQFDNLEVLWLNGNLLRSTHGLIVTEPALNFRLRELYLHDNAIESIAGCNFGLLPVLRHLTLSRNQLRDLETTLDELSTCQDLRILDIFENPCTERPEVRLEVIAALPTLSRRCARVLGAEGSWRIALAEACENMRS